MNPQLSPKKSFKWWYVLIGFLALIIAVEITKVSRVISLEEFSIDQDSFSIKLPGAPVFHQGDKNPALETYSYKSEKNNVSFIITVCKYNEKVLLNAEDMKFFNEEMAKYVTNQFKSPVIRKEEISLNGKNGMRYYYQEDKLHCNFQIFHNGLKVYVVIITGENVSDDLTHNYLNSFKIK